MNGESLDIKQDRLQKLKELLPDLFTENQLDWEKLKASFGDDINFANERYVLNWAGKSDAFKILQQPTTATLKPAKDESFNFDITAQPNRKSSSSLIDFSQVTTNTVLQMRDAGVVIKTI